jgi:hypothetical protein
MLLLTMVHEHGQELSRPSLDRCPQLLLTFPLRDFSEHSCAFHTYAL